LIHHAESTPGKPALIVDGAEISYRSLLARSAAIARHLREDRVARGARVLYCTPDKLTFAAAFLGITGSGRVAVPLPDGASSGTVQELAVRSEATVVLMSDERDPPSGVPVLSISDLAEEPAPFEQLLGELSDSPPADDEAALLLFTSGTTSRKKGVLLSQGNLISATRHINKAMGIDADIREYAAIPLHHSFGLGRLRCVLRVGGTLVVNNGMFEAAKLLHAIGQLQINALSSVPAGIALLMGTHEAHLARIGGAIRVVEIGSAAMPAAHKQKLLELLPNARLFMHYGLTEASRSTIMELRADRAHWDTVGTPAPGVTVSVIDEHDKKLGPNQEGEIVVRGGHVMQGYFRDPELSRSAFCTYGFRTGDLGFLDDSGRLHLRGRKGEMINYGGIKISPLEVEAKLHSVLPGLEFALLGVGDPAGVAGEIPVLAYVASEEPPTREWLLERCADVLDRHELPRAIVRVDEIPTTQNGKVMRHALAKSIEPALGQELSTLWQRFLGVEGVGALDSFFALGGDSLQAAMLVNELQARLGVDVPMDAIFEAPTMADLADYLKKHFGAAALAQGELSAEAAELHVGRSRAAGSEDRKIPLLADHTAALLSLAQQRLWFVEQLTPGTSAYHLPEALFIDGELDVGALQRSFIELVRRHESLRTTFGVVEGQPVQIVDSSAELEFRHEQIEGRRDPDMTAQEILHAELKLPLHLEHGPLFRVRLFELEKDHYVLLYNMHHIISDGWSKRLLWEELSALYGAFVAGRPSPLTDLPIQYADFAAWQRHRLQGDRLESQLTYWRTQLAGMEPLQLRTDHPRPATQSFRGAVESLILPEHTTRAIRAACSEQHVTVFMLLLSAFNALLHRYTRQADIVVGSPVVGRGRKEVEGLIGFFVNMLLLRTDLSGDPSGRQLISRVRAMVVGSIRYQEVPFERLVEEFDPERDQSRNPMFQVTFQHRRQRKGEMKLGDARAKPVAVTLPTTRFDLEARAIEGPDTMTIEFTYSTDLFDRDTIQQMLAHFGIMIEGMLAGLDTPVSQLPLMRPDERLRLIAESRDNAGTYARERCIHALFSEQAAATPGAVAIVFGARQVTFAELDYRANQLANHLRSLAIAHETCVGLFVHRSIEMVVGVLGILKAGGAYVPLDPTYPEPRLRFMLENTNAPLVVTQASLVDKLPDFGGTVVRIDTEWPAIAQCSRIAPSSDARADSLAYVIYTSGSTGDPKGVCVEHRNVVRLVNNTDFMSLGPDVVMLQFAPISFDASTLELWGSMLNGGTLVVFPPHVPSLEELASFIEDHGVTTLWLTAALFHEMVDGPFERLAGVRQLLAGGEALSPPHVQRALELMGEHQILINGYGPTENTTFTCCHRMSPGTPVGPTVPIGRPIAHTTVYVLDSSMGPLPAGIPGELYTGGDGVARGYLRDPELTAQRFVPDPFSRESGARLYRTGDLARRRSDGTFEFLGRRDHQVKLRGFRIELGEIETALMRHPSVRTAAVLCLGDTSSDRKLVAYLVLARGSGANDSPPALQIEALRQHLADALPSYMLPSAFALLDELPMSPNGKLDRTALAAVECLGEQRGETYVAPRTDTEQWVAEIWAKLLDTERVGVHDDFFKLGGHSLMAMQMISRLHGELDVEIPVQQLFAAPTVAGLAQAVDVLLWASTGGAGEPLDADQDNFEL